MFPHFIAGIATVAVFLGLDFLWLSKIAAGFYKKRLGSLLLERPHLSVAVLFYIIYCDGLIFFCVLPALDAGEWTSATFRGAFLGLIAYGTYDITNLATLRGWSVTASIVDLIWGMALSAIAATAGYAVARLALSIGSLF